MGIVTSKEIYERCLNENWAVGGFIGYDMEIMQAAAEAAIKEKAPIMIQASCRVIDLSLIHIQMCIRDRSYTAV